MVNELLNNIYEVKDDEGETLYENATIMPPFIKTLSQKIRYMKMPL